MIGVAETVNHAEALQLAFVKRSESNLARCYIALASVPRWQPIDTAPKDGTRILVWDNGCEIVSWRHDQNNHAWWRTLTGAWFDPKFWMPLPAGPTVTKS